MWLYQLSRQSNDWSAKERKKKERKKEKKRKEKEWKKITYFIIAWWMVVRTIVVLIFVLGWTFSFFSFQATINVFPGPSILLAFFSERHWNKHSPFCRNTSGSNPGTSSVTFFSCHGHVAHKSCSLCFSVLEGCISCLTGLSHKPASSFIQALETVWD